MLFDNNLGTAKNQSELEELLKKHVPTYDPLYVCLATRDDFKKDRQWIEDMWMEYRQFADSNFASAFERNCYQRTWELYLGITLHKRWGLQAKSKHESAGPDFKTIHKDAQAVWIEATAVEKGDAPNRVPEMVWNGVADLPEDQMLLRLTNGLDAKYKGYCKDVKQGIIGTDDPYIIAINRSKLEHLDPQIPLILKCLFRLGCQVLFTEPKKLALKATESFWTTRDHITKDNGEEISMGFFDNPEHSGISAVIYVETDILNSPILPEETGDNFTFVLNPHAKNPLPEELLTFGNV
jgi:hypothetical protein